MNDILGPFGLFALKILVKKVLHPHFPFPLILIMNLGNIWIQNTRMATVLVLFGLTTGATTKVVYRHRGPKRYAFVTIKLPHLPGSQVAC